jgi:hypothetical protein
MPRFSRGEDLSVRPTDADSGTPGGQEVAGDTSDDDLRLEHGVGHSGLLDMRD